MRFSLAFSVTVKTLIAGCLVFAVVMAWQSAAIGEDLPSAEAAAPSANVPAKYADIYGRLNRRVPLNLEKASLDTTLAYLEKHLGGKIELDKSAFTQANLDATEVTLIT